LKSFRKKFIVIFLIIAFKTASFAFLTTPTPTITGSTGLIRMPTADVLPYKNINVGLDIGNNNITNKTSFMYKMNLGTFQGMELGFVGMDDSQGMAKEGVFVNMKYALSTDSSPYPLLLAIGVENLSSFTDSDVYMVATKYLKDGPKLHFGFMGDFPGKKFRPLGMFGFEFPFFLDDMYMQVDMFGGETLFQGDLGIRWYMNESFTWHANIVNMTATSDTPADQYKDPPSAYIGFSLLNPL